MRVAAIWRYPVKSMAGEQLGASELTRAGLPGDRLVHVRGAGDRLVTARTHPGLLGLSARLGDEGEPLVGGLPWDSAEAAAAASRAAGEPVSLVRHDGLERFDVLPLLVGTDGAIAALGVDGRRLRPNIVVGDVPGLAERAWPGRTLRVGCGVIRVASLRARCAMTTYDPDTQARDPGVLRRIVRDFGGKMALDCEVLEPGPVALGDPVEVLD
jgi:uncharacterized protein YcbX